MTVLKQIELAIEVAEQREQKQAQVVNKLLLMLKQEQNKFNILDQYQMDYQERQVSNSKTYMNLYHNYHAFMENITISIERQKGKLQQIESRINREQEKLKKLHIKTNTYVSYHTSIKKKIQHKENIIEEAILEELANLKYTNMQRDD